MNRAADNAVSISPRSALFENSLEDFRQEKWLLKYSQAVKVKVVGIIVCLEQLMRVLGRAPSNRDEMKGDNGDALHHALDELNKATLPLAERLMNSVVRSTLRDKSMDEVDASKL